MNLGHRLFEGTLPLQFSELADHLFDSRLVDLGSVLACGPFLFLLGTHTLGGCLGAELLSLTPFVDLLGTALAVGVRVG